MVPFGLALVGAIAFSLVQYRKEVTTPLASSRITYLLIGLLIVTPYLLTNISQDLSKYPIDHLGNLFNALIIRELYTKLPRRQYNMDMDSKVTIVAIAGPLIASAIITLAVTAMVVFA